LSVERDLVLPELEDKDILVFSLKQLEFNGACENYMTKNIFEMVLKFCHWQLLKKKTNLKIKIKNTSTAERPSVTSHGQESSTWRVAKSQFFFKNSAHKTYKDALLVGCISLSTDPPVFDDSVLSVNGRNESDEGFTFLYPREMLPVQL
jgi:hypothetical protein